MFRVSKDTSYTWPVAVSIPRDDGRFVKATFKARFAYLDQDQIDEVFENRRLGHDNGDILAKALIGWEGIQDEDGQDMPYSEENKTALRKITYWTGAVLDAFIASITGDAARRKN